MYAQQFVNAFGGATIETFKSQRSRDWGAGQLRRGEDMAPCGETCAAAMQCCRRRIARVLRHRIMGEEVGESRVYSCTPGRQFSLSPFVICHSRSEQGECELRASGILSVKLKKNAG